MFDLKRKLTLFYLLHQVLSVSSKEPPAIPLGLVRRCPKLVNPHLSASLTPLPFTAALFGVKPHHTNYQALQLNCIVFPPGKKHNIYVAYKAA